MKKEGKKLENKEKVIKEWILIFITAVINVNTVYFTLSKVTS